MLAGKLKAAVSPRLPGAEAPNARCPGVVSLVPRNLPRGGSLLPLWHTRVILGLSKFQGDPCHHGFVDRLDERKALVQVIVIVASAWLFWVGS